MKTNLIQTCLLAAAVLVLPAAVQARFTYTTTNGAITITGCSGPGGAVVIPATISGLPVISIGDGAFELEYDLTSATIPDSVTNIGAYAFGACIFLSNIIIPSGVTSIGDGAFYECGLTNVIIGDSVSNIGVEAFGDCPSLTVISVDAANLFYSSVNGVLFNKSAEMLVQYPGGNTGSYIIPSSVTNIGYGAFGYCYNLTSVTIPDSVSYIGDGSFEYCYNLTSATIPDSVANIGNFAFRDCFSLTNINIGSGVTSIEAGAFEDSALTSIAIPDGVLNISDGILTSFPEIQGTGAFARCRDLTSVTIGNGVTNIGDFAFLYCSSLTNISIGNGVTRIGEYAFFSYDLTNIIIPDGVSSIGNWAFSGAALTSVTIPSSVTSIGLGAFEFCFGLTSVTFPDSELFIGDGAFSECSSLSKVNFRGNALILDYGVFYGDDLATVFYLPGTTGWNDFTTNTGLPTTLWLPQVQAGDASFGVRTNQFGFNINWASGQTVVVEACSNLASSVWQPIQTNVLSSDSVYFSDPQWTNYSARFYRLRSP